MEKCPNCGSSAQFKPTHPIILKDRILRKLYCGCGTIVTQVFQLRSELTTFNLENPKCK